MVLNDSYLYWTAHEEKHCCSEVTGAIETQENNYGPNTDARLHSFG
jgi:hypothetical protein